MPERWVEVVLNKIPQKGDGVVRKSVFNDP